jgi:hypothetical protein
VTKVVVNLDILGEHGPADQRNKTFPENQCKTMTAVGYAPLPRKSCQRAGNAASQTPALSPDLALPGPLSRSRHKMIGYPSAHPLSRPVCPHRAPGPRFLTLPNMPKLGDSPGRSPQPPHQSPQSPPSSTSSWLLTYTGPWK